MDAIKIEKFGDDGSNLVKNLQQGIKVIPLPSYASGMTAYMNDAVPELVFAQQVNGYGKEGDLVAVHGTYGSLTVAVVNGSAAKRLTAGVDTPLEVIFSPEQPA